MTLIRWGKFRNPPFAWDTSSVSVTLARCRAPLGLININGFSFMKFLGAKVMFFTLWYKISSPASPGAPPGDGAGVGGEAGGALPFAGLRWTSAFPRG